MILGNHTGANGVYTLTGGSLFANMSEVIGVDGTGAFTQSGGSHTATGLTLGSNASGVGSYTLSGSSSSLQVLYEVLGDNATGNSSQTGGYFSQTGGTHQVSQLYMAQNPGTTATYLLSAGTLYASNVESVGVAGTATFNQSSGTNSTVELEVGFGNSANGTYLISGGGLNANAINVGGGLFAGNGVGVLSISGTNTVVNVGGPLSVYNTSGSSINFQAGTLVANSINVHGVPSLFKWTGGTLTITDNVTWDPANTSSTTSGLFGTNLSLGTGKTLNIQGNETIGGAGPFQLTANGGTNNVSGDILLMPGGTVSASGSSLNYTNFIQTGGTLTGTFVNNTNYMFQGGTFSTQFTNNGTATFAANVSGNITIQNSGQITVNSGRLLTATGGITNSGSFILAGGTLSTQFTNAAGATLTAHGSSIGSVTNHGALTIDGVFSLSNSQITNDGVIQGAGIISNAGGQVLNNAGGVINATTPNASLVVTNSFNNAAGAVINVGSTSTLSIGSGTVPWTNTGIVNLQGAGAKLTGTPITNQGTIQGAGLVTGLITSGNNGIIRASGGELDFASSSITNGSAGQIQAFAGSSVAFLQGMTTNSGMISLTGGTFDNVAHSLTNNGTINGYGTIRTSSLTNSPSRLLSIGEGNLDVFGNFTNNGIVNIQTGRSAYFYGTVNGSGSFSGGGTAVFLNSLSPGNSPALVNIAGGATLVGGTALTMELGGSTPGTQYDQLHVGGSLSIGGILTVSLINGFVPTVGSSFDLLDWGTLSGTFSSLSLPTLFGAQWDTSQLYTTGVLSVIGSSLAGDYNGNGVVDAADYVAWRHGLGTTYTQTDYDVWRANFGNTAASGSDSELASGQAQVPEPATALLGLIGVCYLAATGRSRI